MDEDTSSAVKYCVSLTSHWENYYTGPYTFCHVTDYSHHAHPTVWVRIKHARPAVAFVLVQRFPVCAPDAQRCSWLSVVVLSWYAGVGSGAELPGLRLQHTQTRAAPQQLRHQGKRPSPWWVEFRASVWLFLIVFVGIVWDFLFIHFCSDFLLLLFFEQSFEWLAGIYWTKYLQRPSCVQSHTLSFP